MHHYKWIKTFAEIPSFFQLVVFIFCSFIFRAKQIRFSSYLSYWHSLVFLVNWFLSSWVFPPKKQRFDIKHIFSLKKELADKEGNKRIVTSNFSLQISRMQDFICFILTILHCAGTSKKCNYFPATDCTDSMEKITNNTSNN